MTTKHEFHPYRMEDGRTLLDFVQLVQRRIDATATGLSGVNPDASTGARAALEDLVQVVREWVHVNPGDDIGVCGSSKDTHYAGLCSCGGF